jgi:hypothetical protein
VLLRPARAVATCHGDESLAVEPSGFESSREGYGQIVGSRRCLLSILEEVHDEPLRRRELGKGNPAEQELSTSEVEQPRTLSVVHERLGKDSRGAKAECVPALGSGEDERVAVEERAHELIDRWRHHTEAAAPRGRKESVSELHELSLSNETLREPRWVRAPLPELAGSVHAAGLEGGLCGGGHRTYFSGKKYSDEACQSNGFDRGSLEYVANSARYPAGKASVEGPNRAFRIRLDQWRGRPVRDPLREYPACGKRFRGNVGRGTRCCALVGLALCWHPHPWFGVAFVRSHSSDRESSNLTDLQYDGNDNPLPEFYASDPALMQEQPHRVLEQFIDPRTKSGVNRMPYFIEFADKRYVFGFTNAEGKTRPVFTTQPTPYKVSWYEEAWGNWHRKHPK